MSREHKTVGTDVEMTLPGPPPVIYRIDAQDRICFLNEAFLHEASTGGSVDQARLGLLGQSLWRVLPHAADWYVPLVRRVRTDNCEVSLLFRCDTPSSRRLMQTRISPMNAGWVQFASSVTAVQPRPFVALLQQQRRPGAGPFVAMCSWCQRVESGADWLEVEAAVVVLGLHESTELPRVSHGVCPRCSSELTALAHSSTTALSVDLP